MAGIEEAFEKFSDRLAREESKRYSRDEQGDYVEEVQDPYPIKLGPLELGANANMSTGKFSPDEYQNISTMNRNVGLRGKLNIPDSGIALLGSIGDVRSSSQNKLNLPFNPMTGEAEPYSETMKNVYKESPYSVGAQYNPQGTDEMYSALYNKGGGYNLGYNKGPVNVSYTSNPGLGNNVMLRGQYNFADGGVASMFRERTRYANGGTYEGVLTFGNKAEITPEFLYQMEGQFGNDQEGKIRRLKDSYQQSIDYAKSFGPNTKFAGGYGLPDLSPEEYIAKKQEELNLQLSQYDDYNKLIKPKIPTSSNERAKLFEFIYGPSPEVPTVDPFSGQQVSEQNQDSFTQPQAEIFPQQELPTVQPEIFSQQPSLIDTQLPVSNNPALTNLGAFFGINDPIKDFSQFNPETQKILSDTIMRSLPYSDNPNNLDIDYKKYGTEGAPVFQGGYSNILDQAKAGLNALMGDPAEQLRMAYGRFNVNIDPATQTAYMKDTYDFNQGGENNLLNKIGTPYKVNIALPKELTQNIINSPYYQNALAQSSPDQFKNLRAQGSQQEAAARVSPMVAGITPMMAYGGRVSMSDGGLTTTVPPAKGPDSQGVESLFRRRYN